MNYHKIELPWDVSLKLAELVAMSILNNRGIDGPVTVKIKIPSWSDLNKGMQEGKRCVSGLIS